MNDVVTIETDDGYLKKLPYRPDMSDWKVGMIVEVYHEWEKWFCEYRIMDIHLLSDPSGPRYKFLFNRTQKKKWFNRDRTGAILHSVSDKWASDIADEIDKKIFDSLIKIAGSGLNKKINP
jgi:hypothetical protein